MTDELLEKLAECRRCLDRCWTNMDEFSRVVHWLRDNPSRANRLWVDILSGERRDLMRMLLSDPPALEEGSALLLLVEASPFALIGDE